MLYTVDYKKYEFLSDWIVYYRSFDRVSILTHCQIGKFTKQPRLLLSGCLKNYIICMKYKTDIIWHNWLYTELSEISAWLWGWLTQWLAECPWNSRCFRFLKAVSSCFVFQVALVLLAFLTDRSLSDDFFSPRWFLACWFSWSTSVRATWQRATHRIGNAPVQTPLPGSQFFLVMKAFEPKGWPR